MRSPQSLRSSGESPSPHCRILSSPHHVCAAVSLLKQRRFNTLILVFRLAAFCFSLTAAVFMLTTSRASDSNRWHHFPAFRLVFAANSIVAVYSLFEMGASVWEISRGATVFPEAVHVWFDFGHDQAFAYLALAAAGAGAELALRLRGTATCTASTSFCLQATIAVVLGFVGFLFLGLSSLLSGFRVASFLFNGSRFHT